jgi:hypothetical protein
MEEVQLIGVAMPEKRIVYFASIIVAVIVFMKSYAVTAW